MALDGKELVSLLRQIDAHLKSPGTICLIGSGATIMLGQTGRQTDDIDVWASASRIGWEELRQAVAAVGSGFDPKDMFPARPYLQVVHPGIVHVPGWNPAKRQWLGEAEREVWRGERLTVTVPPPQVIAASKLVRGDDRDLEDCLWLMTAHAAGVQDVMQAIAALPPDQRQKATDTLELLQMIGGTAPKSVR